MILMSVARNQEVTLTQDDPDVFPTSMTLTGIAQCHAAARFELLTRSVAY